MLKTLINMNTNRKKVQYPINNIIVYDLTTFNKVRVVPYCCCVYKLSQVSGEYHREVSKQEYQECLNECVVFKRTDCNIEMLDHVLSSKGKPKKIKRKLLNIIYI